MTLLDLLLLLLMLLVVKFGGIPILTALIALVVVLIFVRLFVPATVANWNFTVTRPAP